MARVSVEGENTIAITLANGKKVMLVGERWRVRWLDLGREKKKGVGRFWVGTTDRRPRDAGGNSFADNFTCMAMQVTGADVAEDRIAEQKGEMSFEGDQQKFP